ncbi:adenylyltransferase/cytidyltransferase family protein [Rhodococcus sp. NPDC059968]|uniref:adenylyltransferase/cytidyltransferase family protein n=1 Tax=Rhodococcus sp. NPDC059968 TaxID=3347017 RepID=UPI00367311E0
MRGWRFHIGHLNILSHAASQFDYLIAGVVSDEMARLVKGRNPVSTIHSALPKRVEQPCHFNKTLRR